MSMLNAQCQLFDPIRITTMTRVDKFIIDTWFPIGLIARSLYERLPGAEIAGDGRLPLSSGMTVVRPRVQLGLQINNIRALPVEFLVVDDGPAPLLVGSDFLALLFNMGSGATVGPSKAIPPFISGQVEIDPPAKYDTESVGVRLTPEKPSVEALQLERFLRATREIHNVAVIANTGLHQHDDWPQRERKEAKRNAVRQTIEGDGSLYGENRLTITYVEAGSIWLSLKSGSKAALSWISQIFEKSMDARMRAAMAGAASAEEDRTIKEMTRDEIARAKTWEQRRVASEQIRKTREQWQRTVLREIDFREKLASKIKDNEVRHELELGLEKAIIDLVTSELMPTIEHVPQVPLEERDILSMSRRGPRP